MNWLDYLLALILVFTVFGGIRNGSARTIIGIVSLFVAIFAASWTYGSIGTLFDSYVSSPAIANLIGFAVVFLLVIMAGSAIGWALRKTMSAVGLGWLDRLLGAAVGVFQTTLIAIALVMALTAFSSDPPPRSVVESRSAPCVLEASRVLTAIAPRELRDAFRDGYEKVKEFWNETIRPQLRKLPDR